MKRRKYVKNLVIIGQSVQSLSPVWLFATPWTAACQASLSITSSQSLLKLMSIESVMPSNHLILCHPLLLPPSVFPPPGSFPVSSSHQVAKVLEFQLQHLSFQWTFRTDFLYDGLVGSPCSPRDSSRVFSNTTIQKHHFLSTQLSLRSSSHPYLTTGKTIALTRRTFVSKVMSPFLVCCRVGHSFSCKEQASFNFMAAVTICSDFAASPK